MGRLEKLVPDLRFPDYNENWKVKRIDEITNKLSNPVNVESEILYQQIGIRSHGKGIFHKQVISGKQLGNKRVFWVKENVFIVNIVFAWELAVAKTSSAEKGMIASHRFPMYEPVDVELIIDFIYRKFLTKKGKHLLGLASPGGAGRNKTLGQKNFDELKILIPSIKEQQKIASFLSAVDQKIQQLTRKKELLELYKKGVMQKIFSQEIRFKDGDGNDFPDWEEKQLGTVCDVRDGTHESPKFLSSGYPFVTSKNLNEDGTIDLDNVSYISKIDYDNYNRRSIVEVGDILFGMIGTIGNPVLIRSCGFAIKNVAIIKESTTFKNIFLIHLLKSTVIDKQFYKYNAGGTQKFIALGLIRQLLVPEPSQPEQEKISSFLSSTDRKSAYVQNQITKTQEFKKGLLQRMFV